VCYGQRQRIFEDNECQIHLLKKSKYTFLGWYLHRKYIPKLFEPTGTRKLLITIEAPDWTGITAFMHPKVRWLLGFTAVIYFTI
jgi:hypothetical protein